LEESEVVWPVAMWLEEGGSISLRVTVARDVAAQWGWKSTLMIQMAAKVSLSRS